MTQEFSDQSRWPHWRELLSGEARGSSVGDIWRWWESRRVPYNLLVGIVGFVSWWLVLIAGSAAVKPGVDFEEPVGMFLGPPIYAILANICYTFGPIANLVVARNKPIKRLFQVGLFFSLAITAMPGIWAVYCWVNTLITGQKLD
jgi:hypothetical protein